MPTELAPYQKLSSSDLWKWQRQFFVEKGPQAWTQAIVPEYITSNPTAAAQAAKLARSLGEKPTILELGAGSGRFAWYFLHAWEQQGGGPVNYQITDLAPENIAAWKVHPRLKPYFASKVLTASVFDAENPPSLARPKGPVLVIANYFFDGLPYDLLQVYQSKVFESVVQIQGPGSYDPQDTLWFSKLVLHYQPRPVTPMGCVTTDGVVEWYRKNVSGTVVSLPTCGLGLLHRLRESLGNFVLWVADRGTTHRPVQDREAPKMVPHGSFSVDVNFHALKMWFELGGGRGWLPGHEPSHLTTAVFATGRVPEGAVKIAEEVTGEFGTDEFYLVKEAMLKREEVLTPDEVLAVLRLSNYDARLFSQLLLPLLNHALQLDDRLRRQVKAAIHRAWAGYFHMNEQPNLPFGLGVLLCRMRDFEAAEGFLKASYDLYGPHPHTTFNLAICAMELDKKEEARRWCDQTLGLDQGHERAHEMLVFLNQEPQT